jgi:hypothetical protein
VNENYSHMGGEKMVEKWMQVLDLSVCGVKEKN